jgi:hypothetical protein
LHWRGISDASWGRHFRDHAEKEKWVAERVHPEDRLGVSDRNSRPEEMEEHHGRDGHRTGLLYGCPSRSD